MTSRLTIGRHKKQFVVCIDGKLVGVPMHEQQAKDLFWWLMTLKDKERALLCSSVPCLAPDNPDGQEAEEANTSLPRT